MGWSAARKLRTAVDALAQVLAIELLTASRGIQLRAPVTPSPATGAVIAALDIHPGPDRFLAPEIAAATDFVKSGGARSAAEAITGELA